MPANRLDLAELIADAQRATGLSDFGEPDIHHPLSILIPALNNEAELNEAGRIGQRSSLTRALINRLRIHDILSKHPEIHTEKIRGPIVIVGTPRSDTTKLQRMTASDPGLQKLLLWQLMNPAPFPDARPGERDPRIAEAEQMVAFMRAQYPEFYAAHPVLPEEPDEEVYLMLITFLSSMPMHGTRTPSYKNWMVAQDCAHWYRFLKTMLQFYQWQAGSPQQPWLIKAPWHFRWIRYLFDTFPDATVVHCYRDPVQSVPSIASLVEMNRMMSSDIDHARDVGELILDYWSDAVNRFVTQRTELNREDRFLDISYREIVDDTMGVIRRIYAKANLPLSDDAAEAMRAWERNNPQHKHGRHAYSMERYGYTEELISDKFALYRKRFESLA